MWFHLACRFRESALTARPNPWPCPAARRTRQVHLGRLTSNKVAMLYPKAGRSARREVVAVPLEEEAGVPVASAVVAEALGVALVEAGEDLDVADSISIGRMDRSTTESEIRLSTLRPTLSRDCPPRSPGTFKTVSAVRLEARSTFPKS